MINQQLISPKSIAIIGGSNNVKKPGGKIVKNVIGGNFPGDLYVVNPRETQVQGIRCHKTVSDLPEVDLAILAIRAEDCVAAVDILAKQKNTKAFIIISAGFSEAGPLGIEREKKIVSIINETEGCLIGPNCIGLLNANYQGVFITPTPEMNINGCDLISNSGAIALFVMEAGISLGLQFNSVFSIGNAAQISAEDVLEYMDLTYDPATSSSIKLMYMENIRQPQKLLKHASSLIKKGCKIAAIKAGSTEAGSKAAASHTGAMASSDVAIKALFKKAGIVHCKSREEMVSVASVFSYKKLEGKNIAIITHAGGSAVMLTDTLSEGGLNVPTISGTQADELLTYLNPGSSVKNPIDFLATGTAEQLGIIIDFCEHKFDEVDAMVVVFGSPGLFDVENVYKVLNVKLDVCKKPIFPVLPSLINAQKEIQYFLSKGHVNFPDEVLLGKALTKVHRTLPPIPTSSEEIKIDTKTIQKILSSSTANEFLSSTDVNAIMKAANIPTAREEVIHSVEEAVKTANDIGYPIAMKVVGQVHKSDVGGVVLNVRNDVGVNQVYQELMAIPEATGVILQSMHKGIELFIGAKFEPGFGHVILCGLGGIFVEVMKDVKSGLSPLVREESLEMIRKLKGYPIIQGIRGKKGIDEQKFSDIILKISALVDHFPEIAELDINPLIGEGSDLVVVDARIKMA